MLNNRPVNKIKTNWTWEEIKWGIWGIGGMLTVWGMLLGFGHPGVRFGLAALVLALAFGLLQSPLRVLAFLLCGGAAFAAAQAWSWPSGWTLAAAGLLAFAFGYVGWNTNGDQPFDSTTNSSENGVFGHD